MHLQLQYAYNTGVYFMVKGELLEDLVESKGVIFA